MSTIEKAAERMAALRRSQNSDKSDGETSTIERLAAKAKAGTQRGDKSDQHQSLNRSIYRQESAQESAPERAPERAEVHSGLASADQGNNVVGEAADSFAPHRVQASGAYALNTFNFPTTPDEVLEIDLKGLEEMGYLASSSGKSRQSNEFRRIKRPMLQRVQKDNAIALRDRKDDEPVRSNNRIMITSALPGEGKTYVSLNLAVSMAAEVDSSVTLIDSDVAKGDISRLLNLRERTGLGDVLLDSSVASRGLLATSVNRLSVLPAGTYSEHLGELYASDMMDRLIQALDARAPNQVLLFDAPPILVTTEASVLAQYMDQVILVIEANRTPREAVQRAIEELDGCNNISLLLNKTTQSSIFGYDYGYGYGYGQGGNAGSNDTSEHDAVTQAAKSN
jgi:protein-tyrosine kinase